MKTAAFYYNLSNEEYEFVGFDMTHREILDATGSTKTVVVPVSKGQARKIESLTDADGILCADLILNANRELRVRAF